MCVVEEVHVCGYAGLALPVICRDSLAALFISRGPCLQTPWTMRQTGPRTGSVGMTSAPIVSTHVIWSASFSASCALSALQQSRYL